MRAHQRTAALVAVTAGIAAIAAQPAPAAPEWNEGLPEDHFTQTCESIGGVGGYREEHSSQVRTGTFVDAQNIPKVGEVFYARVAMAAVGAVERSRSFRRSSRSASRSRSRPRIPCVATTRFPTAPIRRSAVVRRRCSPALMAGSGCTPGGNPNNAWTSVGRFRKRRP